MIKNKILDIKVIFKNILSIQTNFYFIKVKRIIFKNYFLELHSKIVIK